MFKEIIMLDFRVPLAKRKRTFTGPYRWQPTEPGKGRGFYQSSNGLYVDPHGSTFDLRLECANDHLAHYSRLSQINGYYIDEFCEDTAKPIIARLPKGRGFLAGYTLGEGMCAALDSVIYSDEESAAFAAHSDAESMAENEREYREENAA